MALWAPAGTGPALVLPDALATPQSTGILRWSSAGYTSGPLDAPANTGWEPRILSDVAIAQTAADAVGIGGRLALGIGEIALADADNALVDLDRWGVADGRTVTIRVIPVEDPAESDFGTPLAGKALGLRVNLYTGAYEIARTDPIVAFRGVTQRVDRTGDRTAVLRVTDLIERLATPLQPAKYQGTGGVEGGEELDDKPKPCAFGRLFNVTPVFLGNIDLGVGSLPTYQFHYREAQAVDAVRIRGVEQALTTGTPTVGQARAFASLGMFQIGSTPDGAVTADVRGDAVGGYVSTTAGIIRRIVTSLGPQLGTADFDDNAWAFAENDLPGEIGWYVGAQDATAADACEEIVAGSGAVLAGGRGGVLRLFDPLANDDDQFTLPDAFILSCRPLPMPAGLRPLPRACAMKWRPNWTQLTDIAGSVASAQRQRLQEDFYGTSRAESAIVTAQVAQQRDLTFRGLYWSAADALARAAKWRNWLSSGPRMFEVVTDRYLGQIECGHIGRIFYPAFGIGLGVRVTVVGWAEELGGRRLTLTCVTQPEA